jgi:lysophospholipase L1-like esterase
MICLKTLFPATVACVLFATVVSAQPPAPASPPSAAAPARGRQAGPADQPAPRTDANSQLAHAQLLEKAKKGRIDLYFLGDSIARRWGATDPQYKDMLANWTANFHGWNAGNFGWGADRVENILWRIENGELDGVNPKVIVILAGTNNLGTQPADDAKIADITRGLKALVALCQRKVPAATIVLTGIFPRNDNMAVIPAINRINENLAQFADGKKIRYLNVNAQLADADGKLFPGMMGDRLHPTVQGYQVWADGLKPILTELLGPRAATDQAPPPTGDPSVANKAGPAQKKD